MVFQIKYILNGIFFLPFYKTVLHLAVERENPEIVKILLECRQIDVNERYI